MFKSLKQDKQNFKQKIERDVLNIVRILYEKNKIIFLLIEYKTILHFIDKNKCFYL